MTEPELVEALQAQTAALHRVADGLWQLEVVMSSYVTQVQELIAGVDPERLEKVIDEAERTVT